MARGAPDWSSFTASQSANEQASLDTTTGTATATVKIPGNGFFHSVAISIQGTVDSGDYYADITITGDKTNFHMIHEYVGAGATGDGFFSPVIVAPVSTLDANLIINMTSGQTQTTPITVNFDFYTDSIPPNLEVGYRLTKGLFLKKDNNASVITPNLYDPNILATITDIVGPVQAIQTKAFTYATGNDVDVFTFGPPDIVKRLWVINRTGSAAEVYMYTTPDNWAFYSNLAPTGQAGDTDRDLVGPAGIYALANQTLYFNSNVAGDYVLGIEMGNQYV